MKEGRDKVKEWGELSSWTAKVYGVLRVESTMPSGDEPCWSAYFSRSLRNRLVVQVS